MTLATFTILRVARVTFHALHFIELAQQEKEHQRQHLQLSCRHGPGSGSVKQYSSCAWQSLQHGAATAGPVKSDDATRSPASSTTSIVSLRNTLSLSVRFISFPFQFEVWLRCGNLFVILGKPACLPVSSHHQHALAVMSRP